MKIGQWIIGATIAGAIGFGLAYAGANSTPAPQATPKTGGFLLVMTVDMGDDDVPVEFVLDGHMPIGECVDAMKKLAGKTTMVRKHETATIIETFACVRPDNKDGTR